MLLLLLFPSLILCSSCPSDLLVVYRLELNAFWDEQTFPKQYPQWRPHAHWSKTIGRGSAVYYAPKEPHKYAYAFVNNPIFAHLCLISLDMHPIIFYGLKMCLYCCKKYFRSLATTDK